MINFLKLSKSVVREGLIKATVDLDQSNIKLVLLFKCLECNDSFIVELSVCSTVIHLGPKILLCRLLLNLLQSFDLQFMLAQSEVPCTAIAILVDHKRNSAIVLLVISYLVNYAVTLRDRSIKTPL